MPTPFGIVASDVFVTVVQILVIIELGLEWNNLSAFETSTLFLVGAALPLSITSLYLTAGGSKTGTLLVRLVINAIMAVSHVHFAAAQEADDAVIAAKADVNKGEHIQYWPTLLIAATVLGNVSTIAALGADKNYKQLMGAFDSMKWSRKKVSKKLSKDAKRFKQIRRSRAQVSPVRSSRSPRYAQNSFRS